jgi:hypothetical protein
MFTTQEEEIMSIVAQSQPREMFARPYLENTKHKKGLAKLPKQ